jgi:hypothetical protein
MKNENFIENINDEKMIEIVDRALKYEKNIKNNKIKPNWLKIIPVVAAIVFVIGLVNILPMIMNIDFGTDVIEPSINIDWDVFERKVELFVPRIVEKDFFETKVLAAITNQRAYNKITAYYHLRDGFYMLDPSLSENEEKNVLKIYSGYTKLTGNDIVKMYRDNGILYDPANPIRILDINDTYAYVRFGRTRDILLLEVEWHTPETYEEEVVKSYNNWLNEYKNSDVYIQLSDEEKNQHEITFEGNSKTMENELNEIKEKRRYRARLINGKSVNDIEWHYAVNIIFAYDIYDNPIDLSQYFDSDGYVIFKIYPYVPQVEYIDENGEWKQKFFPHGICSYRYVSSKSEYTDLLRSRIIPFCDDLLARGLLTQEEYDEYTIADPLDKYVDMWFN